MDKVPQPAEPPRQKQAEPEPRRHYKDPKEDLVALDLADFKQRLLALQSKVEAIEHLEVADKLPPEEAAQMLEKLVEMENIVREGLEGIFSPSVFWQAVRWGGLGVIAGVLLQRTIGCGS